MASPAEIAAMRRAVALSAFGLGGTSPNPPVGCVILDEAGHVVGEGYHARKGEPHAEANALATAGPRAQGGTAVVTLEPCNHQGRTPPCRQALLDAGIARVIFAMIDPISRGESGAAVLRAAGVDVEVGVLPEEARHVSTDPKTILDRLYADGVRALLINGGVEVARTFLDAGLIDRITALLPFQDPSAACPADPSWWLPGDFALTSVTRLDTEVCVRAQRPR